VHIDVQDDAVAAQVQDSLATAESGGNKDVEDQLLQLPGATHLNVSGGASSVEAVSITVTTTTTTTAAATTAASAAAVVVCDAACVQNAFSNIDANQDGYLTASELGAFPDFGGLNITVVLAHFDLEPHDDQLDITEFGPLWRCWIAPWEPGNPLAINSFADLFPNMCGLDSDGDHLPDVFETDNTSPYHWDSDGDGIGDRQDPDTNPSDPFRTQHYKAWFDELHAHREQAVAATAPVQGSWNLLAYLHGDHNLESHMVRQMNVLGAKMQDPNDWAHGGMDTSVLIDRNVRHAIQQGVTPLFDMVFIRADGSEVELGPDFDGARQMHWDAGRWVASSQQDE
jgi:hypothetical protein